MDEIERHYAYNEGVRQELHHEHSVMNSRTGWHHVIQIAMFTAFYKIVDQTYPSPLFLMKIILPIIGVIYAKSALYSLWVSEKARACILMHWNRYQVANNIEWEKFPLVTGDPFSHIRDSEEDEVQQLDMGLTKRDFKIAKKIPHWFMLYNFIPYVFLLLWASCLINIIITIIITHTI